MSKKPEPNMINAIMSDIPTLKFNGDAVNDPYKNVSWENPPAPAFLQVPEGAVIGWDPCFNVQVDGIVVFRAPIVKPAQDQTVPLTDLVNYREALFREMARNRGKQLGEGLAAALQTFDNAFPELARGGK